MHQSFESPGPPHWGNSGDFTFTLSDRQWKPRLPGQKLKVKYPALFGDYSTCSLNFSLLQASILVWLRLDYFVNQYPAISHSVSYFWIMKLVSISNQSASSIFTFIFMRFITIGPLLSLLPQAWNYPRKVCSPRLAPGLYRKTVLESASPAHRGTKISWKWGEIPAMSPGIPQWGGAGVSNDWCITAVSRADSHLVSIWN